MPPSPETVMIAARGSTLESSWMYVKKSTHKNVSYIQLPVSVNSSSVCRNKHHIDLIHYDCSSLVHLVGKMLHSIQLTKRVSFRNCIGRLGFVCRALSMKHTQYTFQKIIFFSLNCNRISQEVLNKGLYISVPHL